MQAHIPFDNAAWSGQVVRVVEQCRIPSLLIWMRFSGPLLYYPSRRHVPAPLRAFVDYLKNA